MHWIDLDANATTPLLPEAWEAMRPLMLETYGNPSSSHRAGRKARQALEDAREAVAAGLGATGCEVVFTSGATEANNLALFGLLREPGAILASRIEHPCILEPLKALQTRGYSVEWLPVNSRGIVEQREVLERIAPETKLIVLMMANHETGAIQPVRHVCKTMPKTVLLHTDAAQAVGKIPVNFRDLGATSLSLSAHKFGGPKGVGALVLKPGTQLQPQLFGGHQQKGHRPGTEPVALAVGMQIALEQAIRNLSVNHQHLVECKRYFLQQLRAQLPDSQPVVVNGPLPEDPDGLPTTLNVSFPGCRSEVLLMQLDLVGVACSTGSACSSGSLLPSPVLEAMQVPDDVLHSAMRFSFRSTISRDEVELAAQRIADCVRTSHRNPEG